MPNTIPPVVFRFHPDAVLPCDAHPISGVLRRCSKRAQWPIGRSTGTGPAGAQRGGLTHLLALRACVPDTPARTSSKRQRVGPLSTRNSIHLLALRACVPDTPARTSSKRQRVGPLSTRNSIHSLALRARVPDAPARTSSKRQRVGPFSTSNSIHSLALRACVPDTPETYREIQFAPVRVERLFSRVHKGSSWPFRNSHADTR